MKKFFLIIVLIYTSMCMSQIEYQANGIFTYSEPDNQVVYGDLSVYFEGLDDNGELFRVYSAYRNIGGTNFETTASFSVILPGRPLRILASGWFREEDQAGNVENTCASSEDPSLGSISIPVNDNCIISIGNRNMGACYQVELLELEIIPFCELIQSEDTLLGYENILSLGCEINIGAVDYNWEYQISENGQVNEEDWLNLGVNQSTINRKVSDLLPETAIGKKVYFRLNTCDSSYPSDPVFFEIVKSAPNILNTEPIDTSCYDSSDGGVTINFGRGLDEGETLSISIEDLDDIIDLDSLNNPIFNSVISEENITDLGANNTFTFSDSIGKSLPKGNFRVALLGFYNERNTDTSYSPFIVNNPNPLEFTSNITNVWCHGGSDGQLNITAKGGQDLQTYEYLLLAEGEEETEEAWASFSTTATIPNSEVTHTITGLAPGTYKLSLRDANLCLAKEIVRDSGGEIVGLGEVIEETITITEPEAPLASAFTFSQSPTAFGFSDGSITAKINGGTKLNSGNPYNFEWEYFDVETSSWELWQDFEYDEDGDDWFIILENAKAGEYRLTVTDANFDAASDQAGCTVVNASFILEQPEKLSLEIAETNFISCNSSNIFNDPSSDGQLTALASGGVPFAPEDNNGYLYIYTWKKKGEDGNYETLNGRIGNVLDELVAGDYAVNITDANGITVGEITAENEITPVDILYTLEQPELLEIQLDKTDINCNSSNGGTISADTSGGIPPYQYQWSTGETSSTLTDLPPGNYVLFVTDARGCKSSNEITIEQPNALSIEVLEAQSPTCNGGDNGRLLVEPSGGVPPYTYQWNTGETTTGLENLSDGTYIFTLTDANGCSIDKEFLLEHPDELSINLGEDRTLCQEQTHDLDASISDPSATYSWTSSNGFTSADAQITVSNPGVYNVVATTSQGCTANGSVEISYRDTAIDVEFLLSSQAYAEDDVVLLNVSDPLGETYEWDLPDEVEIVEQTDTRIILSFPGAGTYLIGLINTQGDCYATQYKSIVVEEGSGLPSSGDAEDPFIARFDLTPNPNTGQFEVNVELAEVSPIAVRIFNIQGGLMYTHPSESYAKVYNMPMNLNLSSGVYFVVLETAHETQVKRLVIL